jgi:hypothetical protein
MGSFMPVMLAEGGQAVAAPFMDVFGIGRPLSAMLRATERAFPDLDFGNNSIGPILVEWAGPLQTFEWPGVAWTADVIGGRVLWVGVAVCVALFAALFFDRFDPARAGLRQAGTKPVGAARKAPGRGRPGAMASASNPAPAVQAAALTAATRARFAFGRVLLAELRLIVKDLRWWWWLVAVALAMAGFLAPVGPARQYAVAFTWLWPVLAWSALGAREARHGVAQLAFAVAHPLGRQLPATWLAGVALAALASGGAALRLLLSADGAGLLAWAAAVLFVPALAVALAVWSGSGKLFEVVYLTLWYFGPLNQIVPQADFAGAGGGDVGAALAYLLAAAVLLGAAFAGRRRRLQQ